MPIFHTEPWLHTLPQELFFPCFPLRLPCHVRGPPPPAAVPLCRRALKLLPLLCRWSVAHRLPPSGGTLGSAVPSDWAICCRWQPTCQAPGALVLPASCLKLPLLQPLS